MGDKPLAGKYWYLTDRDDEQARTARRAFEERFPSLPELLAAVSVRAPFEAYSEAARARLEALRERAAAAGHDFGPRLIGNTGDEEPDSGSTKEDLGIAAAIGGCFLVVVVPWGLGLYFVWTILPPTGQRVVELVLGLGVFAGMVVWLVTHVVGRARARRAT